MNNLRDSHSIFELHRNMRDVQVNCRMCNAEWCGRVQSNAEDFQNTLYKVPSVGYATCAIIQTIDCIDVDSK